MPRKPTPRTVSKNRKATSKPFPLFKPGQNRIISSASNQLFEGAQRTREHKGAPFVDRDFSQNVSALGFREMLSVGRFLYANCPPLRNAVNKIAELAIGNAFLPQFYGSNKAFGLQAIALLTEWHKILDVRGGVNDWWTDLRLLIVSSLRDGDIAILLAESATGYPLIQLLPGHRIGGRIFQNTIVVGGPYDGMPIINGVIFDPYGRAVAIRVVDALQVTFRDVSLVNTIDPTSGDLNATQDAILLYEPDWAEQGRGISIIGQGANDWKDHKQAKDFIKQALRKEASYAVVEYNETGEADTANDFTRTGPISDGLPVAAIYQEKTDGGLTQIYKASTKSRIEFPAGDRPSERSQMFWDKVVRDGFQAIGWPMEFYDSASKGGAAIRLIMELAGPTIRGAQTLAKKAAVKIDTWRIAKAIKSGELPFDPEWWKIRHQTPEELTADKGYSAQIDREDYKIGFTSLRDISARRGKPVADLFDEREAEAGEFLARAAKQAQQHNAAHPDMPITIDTALALLRQASANPPQNTTPQPEAQAAADNQATQ